MLPACTERKIQEVTCSHLSDHDPGRILRTKEEDSHTAKVSSVKKNFVNGKIHASKKLRIIASILQSCVKWQGSWPQWKISRQ